MSSDNEEFNKKVKDYLKKNLKLRLNVEQFGFNRENVQIETIIFLGDDEICSHYCYFEIDVGE